MFLIILTLLSALSISAVAIYYSIAGLAAIFAGAVIPIMVMGSVLEVGKLITASWLYQNWSHAPRLLKYYLSFAVFVLMFITSMGIFGYLSKAHIEHSSTIAPSAAKVQIYDAKIQALQTQIDRNNKNLTQYDEAVDQVMGRSKDEKGAERANQIRKAQQKDRERIATENARLQKEIQSLTEEKLPLSLEVRKAESELGPIKYVADVVYGTQDKDLIDKAVRLIIFVIIVVFDPLAVLLLIAANQTYRKQKKTKKPTKVIDIPAPSSVESFIDKKSQIVPKDKILNMTGELK